MVDFFQIYILIIAQHVPVQWKTGYMQSEFSFEQEKIKIDLNFLPWAKKRKRS